MSKYTRRASGQPVSSGYERLGLSANPFPIQPAAEFGSLDARNNGEIFDPTIRPTKVEQFQDRFLRIGFGGDFLLLGYLMSLGSAESTRGMGKTAMLLHFARELNRDFGPPLTRDDQRVVAVYVSPGQSAKKFEYLSWLTVSGFITQVWRDVFVSLLIEANTTGYLELPETDDDPVLLLDPEWLTTKGVDPIATGSKLKTYLVTAGVSEEFAGYLVAGWGDPIRTLAGFEVVPERRRLGSATRWLFDDIAYTLRASAFSGMFWFVDELENIVYPQNASERAVWAKELRTQLIDAPTATRQFRSLLPVLVTHSGVNTALAQAWTRSGLDQFAPMHKDTNVYTVQLEELSTDDCRRLLRVYLDYFRIDPLQRGGLAPFTDDAVPRLASLCNYHPREILRQAHLLLTQLAAGDDDKISPKYVSDHVSGGAAAPRTTRKGARAKALLGADED